MDTIDIVISVIVVVAYLFFNYKKKEKKAEKPPVEMPQMETIPHIPVVPKMEQEKIFTTTSLEENEKISSKTENYFTYEKINKIETEFYKNSEIFQKENLQNVDNEKEYAGTLTLERDEIIKGIIYGEILKRPNY